MGDSESVMTRDEMVSHALNRTYAFAKANMADISLDDAMSIGIVCGALKRTYDQLGLFDMIDGETAILIEELREFEKAGGSMTGRLFGRAADQLTLLGDLLREIRAE